MCNQHFDGGGGPVTRSNSGCASSGNGSPYHHLNVDRLFGLMSNLAFPWLWQRWRRGAITALGSRIAVTQVFHHPGRVGRLVQRIGNLRMPMSPGAVIGIIWIKRLDDELDTVIADVVLNVTPLVPPARSEVKVLKDSVGVGRIGCVKFRSLPVGLVEVLWRGSIVRREKQFSDGRCTA